jgi:hypothetical protein
MLYLDQDQVWLDIGKEDTGLDYILANEEIGDDLVPIIYLLRTCCLKNLA